jgi:hypothetical protein
MRKSLASAKSKVPISVAGCAGLLFGAAPLAVSRRSGKGSGKGGSTSGPAQRTLAGKAGLARPELRGGFAKQTVTCFLVSPVGLDERYRPNGQDSGATFEFREQSEAGAPLAWSDDVLRTLSDRVTRPGALAQGRPC